MDQRFLSRTVMFSSRTSRPLIIFDVNRESCHYFRGFFEAHFTQSPLAPPGRHRANCSFHAYMWKFAGTRTPSDSGPGSTPSGGRAGVAWARLGNLRRVAFLAPRALHGGLAHDAVGGVVDLVGHVPGRNDLVGSFLSFVACADALVLRLRCRGSSRRSSERPRRSDAAADRAPSPPSLLHVAEPPCVSWRSYKTSCSGLRRLYAPPKPTSQAGRSQRPVCVILQRAGLGW